MQKQKKKLLQFLSLKIIIAGFVFVACIVCFAVIVDKVLLEHERAFDDTVFTFFDSFTTPSLIQVMKVVTFLGSTQFMLPAYIIVIIIFLMQKKISDAIKIGLVGTASQALLYTLKFIFHRQRPSASLIKNITTYSFPSGHTFSSFVFCSILVYIVQHTKWKAVYKWIVSVLLLFLSIAIGTSRIILKVHFPTDVAGSLALGIAWGICLAWLIEKMNRKHVASASIKFEE